MENKKIISFRIFEDFLYNYKLDFLTKFNIIQVILRNGIHSFEIYL